LFKLAHLCNINTLHLQGVSFLSSPSWHVHLEDCSDVSVTDVTIAGPTGRSETDGIDLDNCRRVHALTSGLVMTRSRSRAARVG
jgi:polygalacturonase